MKSRTKPAKLSFGIVCRGAGRIYVQLCLSSSEPASSWESFVLTKDGAEAPSFIMHTKSGVPVLVIAVLTTTQYLTVHALDAEGNVIASASRTIRHQEAKVLSPANSLAHRKLVEEMRQLVERSADDCVWMGDYDFVHEADDQNIIHATLSIEGNDDSISHARMNIRAMDVEGNYVPAESIKVIGDKTTVRQGMEDDYLRTMRIAATVDGWPGCLVIWVQFVDGTYDSCFWVVEPLVMRNMHFDNLSELWPAEASINYHDWFVSHRVNSAGLRAQRKTQEQFAIRPTFSVVIPLYHTPVKYLADAVDSVLEQSYPKLELILVNSTPEDKDLCEAVDRIAESDERVRVVMLEGNRGITENTNRGIEVAKGDFVSFMDHDDVIERDLFFWYVKGINDYPTTDLLYCDEDLLMNRHYVHPVFKPDWSVLFLETNNYACHLLTVRKSIVDELPTPTKVFDGAQDHNMTLAAGERARNVYHVRRVLYHWRSHPLSTAQNPDAKPESLGAGQLSIERHYKRIGFKGRCIPSKKWIHTYETVPVLHAWPSLSVVLWGEGRDAGWLRDELEHVGVVHQILEVVPGDGETWSHAVAEKIREATGELVLVLAREAIPLRSAWLKVLVAYALRGDMGVAAPRLLYADGLIASIGTTCVGANGIKQIGSFMSRKLGAGYGLSRLQHNVSSVDPRCFVTRRELLDELGGWDGSYGMDCACVDFCARVREHGLGVGVIPASDVEVRFSPTTLDTIQSPEEKAKHADYMRLITERPRLAEYDPFYSSMFVADGHFGFEGGWKWIIPMGRRERIRYKIEY